jgi:hypothetical protein
MIKMYFVEQFTSHMYNKNLNLHIPAFNFTYFLKVR